MEFITNFTNLILSNLDNPIRTDQVYKDVPGLTIDIHKTLYAEGEVIVNLNNFEVGYLVTFGYFLGICSMITIKISLMYNMTNNLTDIPTSDYITPLTKPSLTMMYSITNNLTDIPTSVYLTPLTKPSLTKLPRLLLQINNCHCR